MNEVNCSESGVAKRSVFRRVVMFFYFHLILKRLIRINYQRRYESAIKLDGKYKDEWYWADLLAAEYGYFVSDMPHRIQAKEAAKVFNFWHRQ